MWPEVVPSDQELLRFIRKDDRDAFTMLYHRYSARLYQNLLPLVKSPDIAEEIIQELFIRIWEKRASIKIDGNFSAYLYVVGKNLVLDYFRKVSQEKKLQLQLANYLTDDAHNNDLNKERQDALLARAIEQLPPQRQRIFRLCKLEGKSYQEVSLQLGISVGTINDHIVKATKAIQKNLSRQSWIYLFLLILTKDIP